MQQPVPFLWLATQAEEAANFYAGLFSNSRIVNMSRISPELAAHTGMGEGDVLTVDMEIRGLPFVLMNAGSGQPPSLATSLMILCDTQEEIDRYWDALREGGEELACGWITDRFGFTWQITPTTLRDMIGSSDAVAAGRTAEVMMSQSKLDIASLEAAFRGD